MKLTGSTSDMKEGPPIFEGGPPMDCGSRTKADYDLKDDGTFEATEMWSHTAEHERSCKSITIGGTYTRNGAADFTLQVTRFEQLARPNRKPEDLTGKTLTLTLDASTGVAVSPIMEIQMKVE